LWRIEGGKKHALSFLSTHRKEERKKIPFNNEIETAVTTTTL
jgi:hypothetical protein